MENRLVIPIGKNKIVAEIYQDGPESPEELTVYLRDENDAIIQDICLVREHFGFNRKTMRWEYNNSLIDCLVWGESDNVDYTNKHVIGVYDEEM